MAFLGFQLNPQVFTEVSLLSISPMFPSTMWLPESTISSQIPNSCPVPGLVRSCSTCRVYYLAKDLRGFLCGFFKLLLCITVSFQHSVPQIPASSVVLNANLCLFKSVRLQCSAWSLHSHGTVQKCLQPKALDNCWVLSHGQLLGPPQVISFFFFLRITILLWLLSKTWKHFLHISVYRRASLILKTSSLLFFFIYFIFLSFSFLFSFFNSLISSLLSLSPSLIIIFCHSFLPCLSF